MKSLGVRIVEGADTSNARQQSQWSPVKTRLDGPGAKASTEIGNRPSNRRRRHRDIYDAASVQASDCAAREWRRNDLEKKKKQRRV